MKKGIFSLILLFLSVVVFAQLQTGPQWNSINGNQPGTFRTQLVSSSERSIQVNLQVPGFYTTNVTTPRGEAKIVSLPKAISTAKAGEPNLPMTGIPALIGDQARMSIRVVDAQYIDYEGIEVAPSKGDFSRQIDPATVPYTYGECYNQDAFFPANNIGLYAPYIIRDFRGQNMVVYPFAYNPVTKTLRVYYNMTVEMYKVDDNGENTIVTRRSNTVKMDPDFKSVYQRHFINYEEGAAKYTVLDEEGDLLIICYDNFINSMTDFVNWKKTRGINTTIVGTSTAGSTYSAIQTYIRNQYNANNNLTHVLLVGDVAQIPGYTFTDGGSDWSGKGDNQYGQIVGNDIYNDVIIGRFSAGNASQVTTQVNRILTYERDLTTSATWCQNGLGISASAGSGGHYSEDDYQHVENLRTDLLNYGYSTVYQDYKSVSGYPNSTTTTISNHINSGVGIINYCNHGEQTGWQSHYYMNSNVNALTNDNKLPFIFSVACLVGQYDYSSGDCFAETWMHATNGSNPTGAISGMFSYISQPWIPPMWAQDEFVDILVESYSSNIKHSFGGAAINSLFSIFDHYSTSETSAIGTYKAWVLYGDPTLMMRTKTPQAMTVTHNGNLTIGASNYAVNVSNGNGAVATITDASHNILGKATVSNGTATVSLNSSNLAAGSQLTLCVFGYNKVTYLGTINVVGGTQYNITVTQPQHGTISAPAQAYANSTVTLTATPETGYGLSSWTVRKGNTNIPVTNNQFTMPEGDVTLTATFVQGLQVTLASVMNGSISADMEYALQGNTINLTATPETGYVFGSWVVYKTGDVNTSVTVNGNSFTMPSYPVTVSAIFSKPAGGDVTIGSGTNTSSSLPTNVWYKYTTSQQIYTAAELGDAGTITAVSFKYNGNATSGSRTIDIYMTHTTSTTLSTWVAVTSASKVYSGSQTFVNNDWYTITLDTPFEYNGTSNIMITVDDNTGSYSGSSGRAFYSYSTGATRAIYNQNDNYNVTPMSPQSGNNYKATTSTSNSQIIFTKEVPSTEGYLSVSPASLTGFDTQSGTASASQSIAVIGDNLQANLAVTAPNGYEVCATQNGTYNGTLTMTPSNGSVRANVYVRLKANASVGTYNGNLTLASGTTSATVSLSGTVTQGTVMQYAITATANPTAGGTVNGADTFDEGTTCTLTATPNEGYNFVNWTKNGTQVSTNATYTFTVNESADYVANFEEEITDIVQTSTMATGWNWWTPNVDLQGSELLSLLEQGIGNKGIKIAAQDGKVRTYSTTYGIWTGSLNALEVGKMYKIQANGDCSFEISGPAIVVENHSITLSPGLNWIGFFGAESMSLNTALQNLTPTAGDIIAAEDGTSATYSATYGWNGRLQSLVPGKAYTYKSKASSTVSFTYPSVNK